MIHDTREHASHLQLSLPPFSHSLIVLSSQFVVVFMRPYKTGKGRVKKEGTNEGNGGGNPPPIKPVYIEFLRRSSYPEREPTELGTFNFIGEDSPSLSPSFFCFALPILLAIFEVSEIFGAAVPHIGQPVVRPAKRLGAHAASVWGERGRPRRPRRPFLYNKRNVTGLETGHKTQSAVELTSSYKKHEGGRTKVRVERDWWTARRSRGGWTRTRKE